MACWVWVLGYVGCGGGEQDLRGRRGTAVCQTTAIVTTKNTPLKFGVHHTNPIRNIPLLTIRIALIPILSYRVNVECTWSVHAS